MTSTTRFWVWWQSHETPRSCASSSSSEQLLEALESRIVIEQAKGITAHRHRVTIDQAYQRIRTHGRNDNTSLRKVAEAIVEVGLEV